MDNNEIAALQQQINSSKSVDSDVVDALNRLATLQSAGDSMLAFKTASDAADKAAAINYASGQAQALLQKGMCMAAIRHYADAEKFYHECLAIRDNIGDKEGVATALAKLGTVALHEGRFMDALNHYDKAIAIRTDLKDDAGVADLYSNSGIIHGHMGNYTIALQLHLKALRTYEGLDISPRIATSATNIGTIYREQRNYTEALDMFHRALEIRLQANDNRAMGDLFNNIGNVYQEQENYDQALKMHLQALQLREELADKERIAFSYNNLGNLYKALKNYDQALDYSTKSLMLFRELDEKRGLVQSYINLGELYYELKNYKKAYVYLNDAIKLAEETGLKIQLSKALEFITQVYAHYGKYEDAYNNYVRYTQLDKEISNTETTRQIAQMTLRYEIEQKERDALAERIKNAELKQAYNSLEAEKKRSEELLNNILPEEVSAELKQSGKTQARNFENVTVMFADIMGFTIISEQLSAEELVTGLDEYFEEFDKIVEKHGIEKIKTIGDAYLCAGGVPVPTQNHAELVVAAALDFLRASEKLKLKREAAGKHVFHFRIGIHSGHVIAGVVGIKKFAYDIWGDTVNVASRMQQNSIPNRINISHATYSLVRHKFSCEYRGELEAKNKGKMKMYFING